MFTDAHSIARMYAATVSEVFVEEIARWQQQKATVLGTPGGKTGSVTFVQRFRG